MTQPIYLFVSYDTETNYVATFCGWSLRIEPEFAEVLVASGHTIHVSMPKKLHGHNMMLIQRYDVAPTDTSLYIRYTRWSFTGERSACTCICSTTVEPPNPVATADRLRHCSYLETVVLASV